MELTGQFVKISITLMVGLIFSASSSPAPLIAHLNSHLNQNQVVAEDVPGHSQMPHPSFNYPTKADYDSIFAPATPNLQGSTENHGNGEFASGSASPTFFSVASSGDFQVSTYLGPYFWYLTLPLLSLVLLVVIARHFFPAASLGNLVSGMRGAASARSLDLDRMTNAVYEALSTFGESAHVKSD